MTSDILFEPDFVTDSLRLFVRLLEQVTWDDRMRSRKTACYGEAYNYSDMTYATAAMHPLLVPIVDALERKLVYRSNNCLLNYYEDGGSTMGFHSDSEDDLMAGTGVAIISLGAERALTFRSKREKSVRDFPLPSGSLLYMPPGIQQTWKHAILRQEGVGGPSVLPSGSFEMWRHRRPEHFIHNLRI